MLVNKHRIWKIFQKRLHCSIETTLIQFKLGAISVVFLPTFSHTSGVMIQNLNASFFCSLLHITNKLTQKTINHWVIPLKRETLQNLVEPYRTLYDFIELYRICLFSVCPLEAIEDTSKSYQIRSFQIKIRFIAFDISTGLDLTYLMSAVYIKDS